jgi:hypothetical protein
MTERLHNISCRESMAAQLNWACDDYSSPSECPDALVGRFADGRFGIFVHDGGRSHHILRHINAFGTTTPRISELRLSAITNPNLWKNG